MFSRIPVKKTLEIFRIIKLKVKDLKFSEIMHTLSFLIFNANVFSEPLLWKYIYLGKCDRMVKIAGRFSFSTLSDYFNKFNKLWWWFKKKTMFKISAKYLWVLIVLRNILPYVLVASEKHFHTFQHVLFPLPATIETVSQTVNEYQNSSARHFSWRSRLAYICIGY